MNCDFKALRYESGLGWGVRSTCPEGIAMRELGVNSFLRGLSDFFAFFAPTLRSAPIHEGGPAVRNATMHEGVPAVQNATMHEGGPAVQSALLHA